MNPAQIKIHVKHRILSVLGAVAMIAALLPNDLRSQDTYEAVNPTPKKCCECLNITVCSHAPKGDDVDSQTSPARGRNGSYEVRVTMDLNSIIDPNTGNDICNGLTVVKLLLRSKGDSSFVMEVPQVTDAAPMSNGSSVSISVPESVVREHGTEWEVVAYCPQDKYNDGNGCIYPFTMGGGCQSCSSGSASCGFSSDVSVEMEGDTITATVPVPNSDGSSDVGASGKVICKIEGMSAPTISGCSALLPIQPTTTINTNGSGQFVSCQGQNGSSLSLAAVAGEQAIEFTHKNPATNNYRTTKISKTTYGGNDVIRVDTTFNLTTWRYERTQTSPGTYRLEYGKVDGVNGFGPLKRETLTKTVPSAGTHVFLRKVEERSDASASWSEVSRVETTYEKQVHGWVKTKEVIAPGTPDALTSTWVYYQPGETTGPGSSTRGLGRIKQYSGYDGYQSFHTYGLNYESVTTPYADSPTGKTVTRQWNPGSRIRTITTTVGGQTLSKTEIIYTDDTVETRVYTSGGQFLKTKTTYVASGNDFGGKPLKVEHPDHTLTTYAYSRIGNGGIQTIMENGSDDNGSVGKGMRTTTITNSRGATIVNKTEGIGYGTGSALFGSMAVTAIDDLGRPTSTAYHPAAADQAGEIATASNPSWTTTTQYACCGVIEEIDRYGIATKYAYDGIKRLIKTNRMGVTMETVRKGLTTESYRYAQTVSGSLSSSFGGAATDLISKSERNLSGTVSTSYSPDPTSSSAGALVATTSTTTYKPAAGLSTRTVTTTPDNYSQTTDSFLDGRTAATYGDLSPAMAYGYTVNATGEVTSQGYLDGANLRETTTTQQDWAGRTLSTTYQDNSVATMTYNALGQMVKSTDPDGVITLMEYDERGVQVISAVDLSNYGSVDYGSDIVSFSDTYPASAHGTNVMRTESKVWKPGGAAIVVSYSDRTPDGLRSWSTQFPDSDNRVSSSITTLQGGGNWTTTSTSPDGTYAITSYVNGLMDITGFYGSNNALIASSAVRDSSNDPLSGYDSLNRPTHHKDSRTGVASTVYRSATNDLVASATDAGGRTTSFTYDVRGRRTAVTLPDNSVTTTAYNPDSTVAETAGSQTYRTTHTYDYADRQVSMTTYGSTQATTSWTYSSDRGFLTAKTYADNKSTTYTYTAAGRLLTRAWARLEGGNHLVTLYGYDSGGRFISTDYDGTTPDVSVSYDCLSRIITQSNGVATCTYAYDGDTLELDTETIAYDFIPGGAPEFTRVIDRSTDTLGRSTGFSLGDGTNPAENQATYAYGATDGRLASVSNATDSFGYAYTSNSANLLATVTGPVVTTTNTYEATRDVLDIKSNSVTAGVVSSFDYSVNNLGQRTNVATAGSAFPATPNWAWSYNPKGELVTADSSVNAYDRAFDFDGIGNRLEAVEGTTTLTGTANYTPNALNQYTAVGSVNPVYDADGNATAYPLPANSGVNSSLEWDAENRLISSTVSGTTTYQYDSQSRRISKTTGGVTTVYVYDGWNVIGEYLAGSLVKAYTWGMDLSGSMQGAGGVGGLLAVKDATGSYYPTYDGNGNVSEYLDNTGAVTAHFEYDPFGRAVVDTDSSGQFRYRFSTKPGDSETGLYYYGYRYYDPETGRWPSRDPIEESGGVNLYGFLGNYTVSKWDYLGWEYSSSGNYTESQTSNESGGKWKEIDPLQKDCGNCPEGVKELNLVYVDVSLSHHANLFVSDSTTIVNSFAQLLNDLKSKVDKCKCVKRLLIYAHGSDTTGPRIGRDFNITKGDSKLLGSKIKGLMCKKSDVIMFGCNTGLDNDVNKGFAEGVGTTTYGMPGFLKAMKSAKAPNGDWGENVEVFKYSENNTPPIEGLLWDGGGINQVTPDGVKPANYMLNQIEHKYTGKYFGNWNWGFGK